MQVTVGVLSVHSDCLSAQPYQRGVDLHLCFGMFHLQVPRAVAAFQTS